MPVWGSDAVFTSSKLVGNKISLWANLNKVLVNAVIKRKPKLKIKWTNHQNILYEKRAFPEKKPLIYK